MTDLTQTTALDADLYELDTMIAEADSVAAWTSAEAFAVTVVRELREQAVACAAALAMTGRIDAWCLLRLPDPTLGHDKLMVGSEVAEMRQRLAEDVQHCEARALEASDRVELCRHHRETKKRSPMERAYQNFLAEEAP